MNIIEFPNKSRGWKRQYIEKMKETLDRLNLEIELTNEQWELVAEEYWDWWQVWADKPISFSGDVEQLTKDLKERVGLVLLAASGSLIKVIDASQHGSQTK